MINYSLLAKAQDYYSNHGFQYIEVPWYVSDEAKDITRPIDKPKSEDYKLSVNNKYLVASGEQGFLYLYMKGFLPPGKYCTITPCFRFEEIDSIHKKVFMKCELIHILADMEETQGLLDDMVAEAARFYSSIGLEVTEAITGSASVDLEYHETELGSYGFRSYKGIRWVYGTGCAEPRTSFVMKGWRS